MALREDACGFVADEVPSLRRPAAPTWASADGVLVERSDVRRPNYDIEGASRLFSARWPQRPQIERRGRAFVAQLPEQRVVFGVGSTEQLAANAMGVTLEMHWASLVDEGSDSLAPEAAQLAHWLRRSYNPRVKDTGLCLFLPSPIDRVLASGVQRFCDPVFESFARYAADHLVELLESNVLRPRIATLAAEQLGANSNGDRAIRALLSLLDHSAPLVREGAVLGLAHHLDRTDVRSRLEKVTVQDASPGVRSTAHGVVGE